MDINKLIARIKNILLAPKTEWPVIAAEPDSVAGLYKNYIIYVAALTPVATFIGTLLFGIHIPLLGTIHVGFGALLAQLILGYAVSLGVTFLMALIINALAPSFGGTADQVQALKAAAYSYTAAWVVGVLNILPGLGALVFLLVIAAAIYGIYLLFLGLQQTMKSPADRAGGYTAVVVIVGIVVGWVFALVVGIASGVSGYTSGAMHGDPFGSSSGFTPDRGSALGALAAIGQKAGEASKKMDEAQKSGDANAQAAAATQMLGAVLGGGDQVEALTPEALKAFLPETLGGMPRVSYEAARNAPIGIQVSNAKATYRGPQGGPELRVEVTDTGGAKGFMALAGFAGIEEDKQSDSGYEKTYHQDGRMIHEQWNNGGSGEYTIVLGDRFLVAVHGSGVANIDALKAAIGAVNLAGLEALKNQGVKKG
ncbi:MAG: Yip1 family protein [Rudaea sp.]|nr:Yip1 family protein [Rudaea sp.]